MKFLPAGPWVALGVLAFALTASAKMQLFRLPAVEGKRPAFVLGDEIGATARGLTVLKVGEKFVYVDGSGRVVIPARGAPGFEEARPFGANGLAAVRLNGKFGYINRAGEFVVPAKYESADDFDDAAFVVVSADGKWGVLAVDGRELIPATYESVRSFYGERFGVFDGTAWAMADQKGRVFTPFHFQSLGNQLGYGAEGLIPVQHRDGRWGFAAIATGQVVVPTIYDEVGRFSDGFSAFVLAGKCGYVDRTGRVVIEPRFEGVDRFSEGLAAIYVEGRWGYLDAQGRVAIAPAYDSANPFSGGLASVKRGEEWLTINRQGELVAPPPVAPADVAPAVEPELVTTPQRCTVRLDHLNLGLDLQWDGKGRATGVRVFMLESGRTLAWDARLAEGRVHDGLFMVEGKVVIFDARQGFALDAWERQIAAALLTRAKQSSAPPAPANNAARSQLVAALKAISADIDEVDKLAPALATLRFEFDIDASTPDEAAVNRINKARAYVDRVKALTTKIDRAFAELPILNVEQRALLDGIRQRDAANVQELLALK